MLSFRRPRDKIFAKINTKPKSGQTIVRIVGPISIRVRKKVISRGWMNKKTMRESNLKIAKDMLKS